MLPEIIRAVLQAERAQQRVSPRAEEEPELPAVRSPDRQSRGQATYSVNPSGESSLDRNIISGDSAWFNPNPRTASPRERITNAEAKIKHWPLSFRGRSDRTNVEDFIFQAETLRHRTLDGNFSLLSDNAHMLFKDGGLEWYWRFQKGNRRFSWYQLTSALRESFATPRTEDEVLREARERYQQPGESFDSFFDDIMRILDNLPAPLPEPQLLGLVKENLSFELQAALLYQAPISLEHLRSLCLAHERLMKRRKARAPRITPGFRHVNELEAKAEVEAVVEAVTERPVSRGLTCWNCQSESHKFQQCDEAYRIFCWSCGRPDTYKHQCPRCQQGNIARGEQRILPTRPRKTARETGTQTANEQ